MANAAPACAAGAGGGGQIVEPRRLAARTRELAAMAGASEGSIHQMLDLLGSPLGHDLLLLAADPQTGSNSSSSAVPGVPALDSLLVSDLYKLSMQAVYARFMTGVSADFALAIRRCGPLTGAEAARALTGLRERHPGVFAQLSERVRALQQLEPLHPSVLSALDECLGGYKPPLALQQRLQACGVAPIAWQEVDGALLAIGSGPIEAASNTETSCMQAVQAALIAAAAEDARQRLQQPQLLDRTERLASSLAKLVVTVERLNAIPHGCRLMVMAGRRSTDLLHLVLQNLYFMKHARGYAGTSSLLATAVLRPLLERHGLDRGARQALLGRLMGTHAHELASITQQLLAGYDDEAGTRCGLQAPVCVSQLVAHLLFLVVNGPGGSSSSGSSSSSSGDRGEGADRAADGPAGATASCGGTALPDTFTTSGFVTCSLLAAPPPEFVSDMAQHWSLALEPPPVSRVFDLFRVWRLDSGPYAELAALLRRSEAARNEARAAAGLALLPAIQLLHSNLESLQDIQELAELPQELRPAMLGFGGLADGFLPFQVPRATQPPPTAPAAAADAAAPPPGLAAAGAPPPVQQQQQQQPQQQLDTVELPVASLVMKAVQARPTTSSRSEPLQACAAKLGDGGLGKAQTDPRLPVEARSQVLARLQAAVAAGAQLGEQHSAAISEVLREAYCAVTRQGLLMAA